MFFNPKFEAEIGPSRSVLSAESPPLFRRLGMEEYVKGFFSRNLRGKSNLERMRIKVRDGDAVWLHVRQIMYNKFIVQNMEQGT